METLRSESGISGLSESKGDIDIGPSIRGYDVCIYIYMYVYACRAPDFWKLPYAIHALAKFPSQAKHDVHGCHEGSPTTALYITVDDVNKPCMTSVYYITILPRVLVHFGM